MENVNDISTGLRVPSQVPLDSKTYFLNESQLANLGSGNNLAFTYYKGMLAYCAQENKTYRWKEVLPDGNGIPFLLSHFIYPNNWVVNGVDYSNKKYNFFFEEAPEPAIVPNPEQLAKIVSMSFHWKNGLQEEIYTPSILPAKVTNNVYNRTGYIGYFPPIVNPSNSEELIHPDFIEDPSTPPILVEVDVRNLGIEVKNFDLVQNFTPTLVISKYTPTKRKSPVTPELDENGEPFPAVTYTKSSFKIPAEVDNSPVRPTRIPLNGKFQIIDFGQEHFFKTSRLFQTTGLISKVSTNSILEARNMGKRTSQVRFIHPATSGSSDPAGFIKSPRFSHRAFVYLQFHLELTINDVKYLTEPLGKLKMEASVTKSSDGNYVAGDKVQISEFNGKIIFKHT